MRRVLGAFALSACAVLGTSVAHAQSPCDAYSGTCVEGTKHVKGGTTSPEVAGTWRQSHKARQGRPPVAGGRRPKAGAAVPRRPGPGAAGRRHRRSRGRLRARRRGSPAQGRPGLTGSTVVTP